MDRLSESYDFFSGCHSDHAEVALDDYCRAPADTREVDEDVVVIHGVRQSRFKSWETIHRRAIARMRVAPAPGAA
jgi:hypothetical protein